MSLHPVDGILFDIDDTLVDTRGAFGAALATIARRYLPNVTPDQDADLVTFWRADVNDHFGRYTRGEIGQVEQRMARANELHEKFGGPVLDDEGFAAWDEVFDGGFRAAWSAHDDVDEVLERLVTAGLHVGVLTNAAVAYQADKLERTGLADRVPLLVGLDTLGFGKPDPRVFHHACRLLGTQPGDTFFVGDRLDHDAVGARDAGLRAVWLDRSGGAANDVPAGVTRVTSLAELEAVVA